MVKSNDFVISFDKLSVFFKFTISLAYIYISPEDKSTAAAAAGFFSIRFDCFTIPSVAVPSVANIFVACHVAEAKRTSLVSGEG